MIIRYPNFKIHYNTQAHDRWENSRISTSGGEALILYEILVLERIGHYDYYVDLTKDPRFNDRFSPLSKVCILGKKEKESIAIRVGKGLQPTYLMGDNTIAKLLAMVDKL